MISTIFGFTDFAFPLLALYGKQYLYAVAGFAHFVRLFQRPDPLETTSPCETGPGRCRLLHRRQGFRVLLVGLYHLLEHLDVRYHRSFAFMLPH